MLSSPTNVVVETIFNPIVTVPYVIVVSVVIVIVDLLPVGMLTHLPIAGAVMLRSPLDSKFMYEVSLPCLVPVTTFETLVLPKYVNPVCTMVSVVVSRVAAIGCPVVVSV